MDQRSSLDFEEHARSPYPALSLSLMRLSVPARLAIAALLSLLLWGAIYWACLSMGTPSHRASI
jgi:hypothetical protein